MFALTLNDIVKQFLYITTDIENSIMFDKSLEARKKRTASNRIFSSVQPLFLCVKNERTPSKNKIKQALSSLKSIPQDFQTEEFKKAKKYLKAYLADLG